MGNSMGFRISQAWKMLMSTLFFKLCLNQASFHHAVRCTPKTSCTLDCETVQIYTECTTAIPYFWLSLQLTQGKKTTYCKASVSWSLRTHGLFLECSSRNIKKLNRFLDWQRIYYSKKNCAPAHTLP